MWWSYGGSPLPSLNQPQVFSQSCLLTLSHGSALYTWLKKKNVVRKKTRKVKNGGENLTLSTNFWIQISWKTLDTIGNCQRPLVSLSVSQHMLKITNLWKFELNWSSKLRENNRRRKNPCRTKLWAFRCLISRPQN